MFSKYFSFLKTKSFTKSWLNMTLCTKIPNSKKDNNRGILLIYNQERSFTGYTAHNIILQRYFPITGKKIVGKMCLSLLKKCIIGRKTTVSKSHITPSFDIRRSKMSEMWNYLWCCLCVVSQVLTFC